MQSVETGKGEARSFVLKLEPGERVVESLARFARDREVRGAWVSGLGAVREAELGWFDTKDKAYVTQRFQEILELVSLTGNVGRAGKEAAVHVHAVCAGRDLKPVAGHLVEAECAVTVELKVAEFPCPLQRIRDDRFGLNLLSLPVED